MTYEEIERLSRITRKAWLDMKAAEAAEAETLQAAEAAREIWRTASTELYKAIQTAE